MPHDRLLNRLQGCGLGGKVLKWFSSFLEDRHQEVWSPPFAAPIPALKVGVPQGSILSPTLFNLYMSPLAPVAEACRAKVISYADDTQLLFTCDKGADFKGGKINQCLTRVFTWLRENQLKCNPEKSEVIFFGSPPLVEWNRWWPSDMSPPLSSVSMVKNLGIKMHNALSMKAQVQSVAGSCFGLLRMLRKFLPLLPLDHRKTVVQALIVFRLDYVNVLYLGLPEYLLNRLQVVQNAAARVVLLKPRTHISPEGLTLAYRKKENLF